MKKNIRKLVEIAAIAAIYTAVSLALAAFSFGAVQVRVSEALTLLPVVTPLAIPGLTLGCFLSNMLGMVLGLNPVGWMDMIVGTCATLISAIFTRMFRDFRIKNIPVYAAIPPVLVNAVFVGAELTYIFSGGLEPKMLVINMLSVGAGQLVSCFIIGLPFICFLERSGLAVKIFGKDAR